MPVKAGPELADKVSETRRAVCPDCEGTGTNRVTGDRCDSCHGTKANLHPEPRPGEDS